MCPAIRRFRFRQLAERGCAPEHTVTLDEREVGGHDGIGARQEPANLGSRVFIQEPGKDGTRLPVDVHREPRSSSRSWAALARPRRLRGNRL
jgi:hypothetical protein